MGLDAKEVEEKGGAPSMLLVYVSIEPGGDSGERIEGEGVEVSGDMGEIFGWKRDESMIVRGVGWEGRFVG